MSEVLASDELDDAAPDDEGDDTVHATSNGGVA